MKSKVKIINIFKTKILKLSELDEFNLILEMEQKDFITVWPIFSINKKIVALLNIIGIN
jgi:hypothetical protein